MIIEEIRRIKSGRKELRHFGMIMGSVLLGLGVVGFLRRGEVNTGLWVTGALFLLLGMAAPASLKWVQKAWMALGVVMGWFMTRLILLVLFFVILTPVALLARLSGRRFMDTGFDGGTLESFWIARAVEETATARFEKQF